MTKIYRAALVAVTLTQAACATDRVIRDREYESSVNAYRLGDPKKALEKFPKGEPGGLITSVEKSSRVTKLTLINHY
jgi:hypothetical protein